MALENNPAAGLCDLPEQYTIVTKGGNPRREFIADYRQMNGFLYKTLPKGMNADVDFYPTTDPQEFVRLFKKSPVLQQQFTLELFTFLKEIEKTRIVNGKKLYDHQYAQLIWLAQSLCNGRVSPETFLLQGSGGIGKTLILGVIAAVLIRLQIRDVIQGRIAICAHKSYILMQQLFSQYQIQEKILHHGADFDISTKDVHDICAYAAQLSGGAHFFESPMIKELCKKRLTAPVVKKRLIIYLESISCLDHFKRRCTGKVGKIPKWEHVLTQLSLVIANREFLIHAPTEEEGFEQVQIAALQKPTKKGRCPEWRLGIRDTTRLSRERSCVCKEGCITG